MGILGKVKSGIARIGSAVKSKLGNRKVGSPSINAIKGKSAQGASRLRTIASAFIPPLAAYNTVKKYPGAAKAALMGVGKGGLAAGALALGAYGVEKVAERLGVRGGAGFIGARRGGGRAGRHKRINPMNVKAARRAATRIKGARKLLHKIESMLPKRKATSGSGMPFWAYSKRKKR